MTTEQNESPKVMFVVSGPLSPDATKNEPVAWVAGQPHPLIPTMTVVGMFVVPEGVEIYAAAADMKGSRSFIPMHWIRYIQQKMSPDVFGWEFEDAQLAVGNGQGWMKVDDDDDDEDESPGDTETTAPLPPANGQASP